MNDHSNSSNITKTNLLSMSSDNYRRSQETIIAQITSFAILGIITVLGNLASIITFAKTQSLRKRSNYTIINLSIADLLVSIAIFMACYYYLFEPAMIRPQYLNIAFDFVDSFTSAASMIALTMISVERFYAVVFPFKHMMLRFKHHIFLCLAPWLVAAATVLTYVGLDFPGIGHKNFVTHITVRYSILFLALIVIVVSYLGIWLKSRYENPSAQDRNRSMRDLKLSVTLFIVTLVSLSAWLPIQIFQIANFFHPTRLPNDNYYIFMKCLHFSNSAINFFIYILRMRNFRVGFLALFGCKRERLSERSQSTTLLNSMMQIRDMTSRSTSSLSLTRQKAYVVNSDVKSDERRLEVSGTQLKTVIMK